MFADGADGAFYPDDIQRPPVRAPSWGLEDNVVCSQPARNLSRPDGLEDPEDSNVSFFVILYMLDFHLASFFCLGKICQGSFLIFHGNSKF